MKVRSSEIVTLDFSLVDDYALNYRENIRQKTDKKNSADSAFSAVKNYGKVVNLLFQLTIETDVSIMSM